MADSSTPQEPPSPESFPLGQEKLDLNGILEALLLYLKGPGQFWAVIQATFRDPHGFFKDERDGTINHAIGFLGCVAVYGLAFAAIGALFQLYFLGIILAVPFALLAMVLQLVIGGLIVWALGIYAGKGKGTLMDGAKVVALLSWIGLIGAFPPFVWLPILLQSLITAATLLLWAYLLIPAVTAKFSTTAPTHRPIIWAVAGVFAAITLMGALLGKGAEVAGDRYTRAVEQAMKDAEAEAARIQAQVEAEIAAEREAAAQEEASRQADLASNQTAAEEDPKKAVRDILRQLRDLGEAEVPRELRQAFRKYNGHLEGADFSGIRVSGLDLRMLNLSGASFRNAVMKDWTFHGIGNTPASKLDGADFSGATMDNVNMTGVSAREADFSGVTLVGAGRAKTVLDLEEADVSGADFSDIRFTGDVNAKALYLARGKLEGAVLKDAQLPNSDFTKARLRGADFSGSDLRGIILNGADIRKARFRKCDLEGMQISTQMKLDNQFIPFDSPMPQTEGADFSGARLDGVKLNDRRFRFCNFSEASLIGADLEGGVFVGSDFSKADLTNAILKRANFAMADFSGARFHNNDWEHAHTAGATLKGLEADTAVHLPNFPEGSKAPRLSDGREAGEVASMVDGSRRNWTGADLKNASFAKQRLTNIDFTGADLQGAVFHYAELGRCNFSLAKLKGASFAFARLNQCRFDEADLTDASFHGAVFRDNAFAKAVLAGADFSHTGRAAYPVSSKLNFEGADLTGASFAEARLSYVEPSKLANALAQSGRSHLKSTGRGGNSGYIDFDGANLTRASLRNAHLEDVSLAGANLTKLDGRGASIAGFYATWDTIWEGADFTGANMSYGQIWHVGATRVTDGRTDFAKATVRGANLYRFGATPGTAIGAADFSDCVFGVDPWGVFAESPKDYGGADLTLLNLQGARFRNADLRGTNFMNSNISGSDFSGADLSFTQFSVGNSIQAGGDLEKNLGDWSERYRDVNFSGSRFDQANLASGDFSGGNFSGISAEGTQVHRAREGDAYQPMSYVYGFPAF